MGAIDCGADLSVKRRGRRWCPALLFRQGRAGAWFDASDPATLFQDSAGTVPAGIGDPVGRIADKSGGGRHAVQAVAAARPVLRKDMAGRRYLEFDGVDDYLTLGTGTVGATGLFAAPGQAFMAFALAGTSLDGGAGTIIGRAGPTAVSRTLQLFVDSIVSKRPTVVLRGTENAFTLGASNGAIHAMGVSWDGMAAQLHFNLDGPRMLSAGTAAEETAQPILIGARTQGAPSFFFAGKVREIVLADFCSAAAIDGLRGYLARRR